MKFEHQEQMLSPSEVRSWLRCGRSKIYSMIQSGELPSYRVGRLVRIKRGDVERYLHNNRYTEWD